MRLKSAAQTYNSNSQDTACTRDGNGKPTVFRGTSLSFDAENRLTAVGTSLTAGYTGDSLRAWKQGSTGGRTYFQYDGTPPVVELDGAGNVTAVNTFGASGLLSRRAGCTSLFYTFDPQGSVTQRLDASGNVLTSDVYDAFGGATSSGTPSDPFGYGAQWGYYTDRESGLLLLTFRYYDAGTGRFLNRDSTGVAGGANIYAYCLNGPTTCADPDGTGPWYGGVVRGARVVGPWGIIILGGAAVYGLAHYSPGHAVEPSTQLGDSLGALIGPHLFPLPAGAGSPIQISNGSSKGSKKDRSTNVPSWCRDAQADDPREEGESCQEYIARLFDKKYGRGGWKPGPNTEFNRMVKNCQRDPDKWRAKNGR